MPLIVLKGSSHSASVTSHLRTCGMDRRRSRSEGRRTRWRRSRSRRTSALGYSGVSTPSLGSSVHEALAARAMVGALVGRRSLFPHKRDNAGRVSRSPHPSCLPPTLRRSGQRQPCGRGRVNLETPSLIRCAGRLKRSVDHREALPRRQTRQTVAYHGLPPGL